MKKRILPIFFSFVVAFLLVSLCASSSYAQELGQIVITPKTSTGNSLTVDVLMNGGSSAVNTVQANILYPNSLKVTKIDTSGSAFDIQAENSVQNSIIKIARGVIKPVSGQQKIATITFSGSGNASDLRVSPDSAIVRSVDNKNIYTGSQTYYPQSVLASPAPTALPTGVQPTSKTSLPQKGFFAKLVQWNNSFWDSIFGVHK